MIAIKHNPIQSTVSGVSFEGLTVTQPNGRPASLAIVDDRGHVIEAGTDVAAAVWNTAIECHRQFLIGHGHLRIQTVPPGGADRQAAA